MTYPWQPKEDRLQEGIKESEIKRMSLYENMDVSAAARLPLRLFEPITWWGKFAASRLAYPWTRKIETEEPDVSEFRGQMLPRRDIPMERYEAWQAPPGVKGAMELVAELPIWSAVPFSGLRAFRALKPTGVESIAEQAILRGGQTVVSPLAGVEKLGEIGVKAAKGVYLKQLEAHRISRELGLDKKNYQKLAKTITGKKSMADMNADEAERFVVALTQQGGQRDITLPLTGSQTITRTKAKMVAWELAEYMGGVTPKPEGIVSKQASTKGFVETIKDKIYGFTNRTYRLERIFEKIDGYPKFPAQGKLTQTFWNPVNQAADVKLRNTYSTLNTFRSFMAANNINFKGLVSRQIEIEGVPLTTGERMGVYLHSKNPDNLMHLKFGNRFSDEAIQQTMDSLTPEEKAVADWIFKYWQTDTPNVAQAYKTYTGKNMKVVENYVPIVIKGEDVSLEDMLTKEVAYRYTKRYPSTMIKKGFTKARTGKAKQQMDLDVLSIFMNRLPEVEHYKLYAPILRDLQRIYVEPKFKSAFIKKESKPAYDVLGQWLRDVAATNPLKARNYSERLWQQARVNATTAVLGLNITTALKQFPSFMIGAAEIGNMPALKGLFTYIAHPLETSALIKRLSPQLWKRSFEREIAEAKLMKNIEGKLIEKRNWREIAMIMTTSMDRLAVNSLWRGAFDDATRKGFSEHMAAEWGTRVIRRTQPFFGVKDVPEFWRSTEGMKALVMFTNQLNQYWNYYRHDVWGSWLGGKTSTGEALKKTIEGFIIPSLMIGAISRSRPAHDAKELLTDVGNMAFASIPVLGHYLSAGFSGWHDTQGLITTEVLDKLQQLAYRLNPDRWDKVFEDIPRLGELAVQAAGYVAGAPVTQPVRTIKALIDLAEGNTDDLLRLIWGSFAREEATKEGEIRPNF